MIAPALWALVTLACATPSDASSAASPTDSMPAPACCRLSAGTPVELEVVEPLGSDTQRRGDTFALRLTTSVLVDGAIVIPVGTPVVGEIVHAARSHGGGQPGELILAARYVALGDIRIPLRGFKLGQSTTGRDTTQVALAASFGLGPFAQFIHGHEIEIPPHASGTAKIAQDTMLSVTTPPTAPVDSAAAEAIVPTPILTPSKE